MKMLMLLIASVTDMRGTLPTAKGHDICVCLCVWVCACICVVSPRASSSLCVCEHVNQRHVQYLPPVQISMTILRVQVLLTGVDKYFSEKCILLA